MKSRSLGLIALITISTISSYAQGVHFEKGLMWKQVLAKAKAENKYIFIDCYTTWCGPCKWASQNIFPKEEIGVYYNSNFINVAVQMDEAQNDSEPIKSWYADAKRITNEFSVSAYPTYLFLDPNGQPVHRYSGLPGNTTESFVKLAKDAMNPERQYYSVFRKLQDHKSDSSYLRREIERTVAYDKKTASIIGNFYLSTLKFPFEKENIDFLSKLVQSSNQKAFRFFLANLEKIDSIQHNPYFAELTIARNVLGPEEIDTRINYDSQTISWIEVVRQLRVKYPELNDKTIALLKDRFQDNLTNETLARAQYLNIDGIPKWDAAIADILIKYPGADRQKLENAVLIGKPRYFKARRLWPEFEKAMLELMLDKHAKAVAPIANDFLWDGIFLHSTNQNVLEIAAKWCEEIIKKSPNYYELIDTYANLLFKSGNTKDALKWEKIAVERAEAKKSQDPDSYLEITKNYEKMKSGEKTWLSSTTDVIK